MNPEHSGLWVLWCLKVLLVVSTWLLFAWMWWRGCGLLWRWVHRFMGDETFGMDPLAPWLAAAACLWLLMFFLAAGLGFAGLVL